MILLQADGWEEKSEAEGWRIAKIERQIQEPRATGGGGLVEVVCEHNHSLNHDPGTDREVCPKKLQQCEV